MRLRLAVCLVVVSAGGVVADDHGAPRWVTPRAVAESRWDQPSGSDRCRARRSDRRDRGRRLSARRSAVRAWQAPDDRRRRRHAHAVRRPTAAARRRRAWRDRVAAGRRDRLVELRRRGRHDRRAGTRRVRRRNRDAVCGGHGLRLVVDRRRHGRDDRSHRAACRARTPDGDHGPRRHDHEYRARRPGPGVRQPRASSTVRSRTRAGTPCPSRPFATVESMSRTSR